MPQIDIKDFEDDVFQFKKLPILLYAGMVKDEPEWHFPYQKHCNFCEIVYISQGIGKFKINDKSYNAQKGDIIIYNKNIMHEEISDVGDPLKTYYCAVGNIHIEGIEEGYIIPQSVEPIIHADKYSYKVENYISGIFEECNSQVIGHEIICQNLLTSLIILVIRIINVNNQLFPSAKTTSLGHQIKKYIDKNYTKDINLSEIANTLYISQHYISHIFKNELGDSPINYLIHRRMEEAKKMLALTNKTILDVSRLVGYENANYFSTLFKKLTGLSPGKFRENMKNTQ